MTTNAWMQLTLYFAVLLALVKPLGAYMARVYRSEPSGLDRLLGPIERAIYRISGIDPREEMSWQRYALAMLMFNLAGFATVYVLLRLQGMLPLNPQSFPGVSSDLAFDTAASFATNTNWQSYGGETTLSYLSQTLGLTVQNFVSAASGMAVLVALFAASHAASANSIGNFWFDLVRSTVYILLPLSIVLTLVLVSQGVIQNFSAYKSAAPLRTARQRPGPGDGAGRLADCNQATRHERRRFFQRQLGPSL